VRIREVVADPANERFVSLASCWEISIKHSIGRLTLDMPLDQMFHDGIEGNGLTCLDINRQHLLELPKLPPAHGDPFDRLLIAQARVENLILVSNDRALDAYSVQRLW
jgi:PIN domain nuclease of toxin-antitoxin system